VARCGFHKKHAGTHYAKVVFSHLVLSAGHVVYSGASKVQNVNVVCFILGWDVCGFPKKHNGSHYAELMDLRVKQCILVCAGCKMSMHYLS
jgi:hypothetical protein